MMKKLTLLLLTVLFTWSCTNNNQSGPNPDDYDREAILVNWADNIIIPSFTALSASTEQLHADALTFTENPTPTALEDLRSSWQNAYLDFQYVSMFEMGAAMDVDFRFNMNIYPTDTLEIKESIQSGSYDLLLPSLNDSQGFPALDYMINGLGDSDTETLTYYTVHENAAGYQQYLNDLTSRVQTLTQTVLNDWTSGYRDQFVTNSGNGANSSLDMMVNDYIFYYEKHLRAGKIGIPAGVFSGTPLSNRVEAYYSEGFSKDLFMEALNASQAFFNGQHFESTNTGESLNSYLDYLNTMKNSADLATLINNQFDAARQQANTLNPHFGDQVESDNSLMLTTYDALNQNVIYMKVDMLQALNINVDYVDADGD